MTPRFSLQVLEHKLELFIRPENPLTVHPPDLHLPVVSSRHDQRHGGVEGGPVHPPIVALQGKTSSLVREGNEDSMDEATGAADGPAKPQLRLFVTLSAHGLLLVTSSNKPPRPSPPAARRKNSCDVPELLAEQREESLLTAQTSPDLILNSEKVNAVNPESVKLQGAESGASTLFPLLFLQVFRGSFVVRGGSEQTVPHTHPDAVTSRTCFTTASVVPNKSTPVIPRTSDSTAPGERFFFRRP